MNRVAKRYAKALFQLALEEQNIEAIEADVDNIRSILQRDESLSAFLANPLISESKKANVLKDVFKGKTETLTYNFLLLLAKKKRASLLSEVVYVFRLLLLEYRNQTEGELVSARELNEDQLEQIKKNVESATGKSVQFKHRIDDELLGGFIVRVGDKVIDSSIRYHLIKLREQLVAQ